MHIMTLWGSDDNDSNDDQMMIKWWSIDDQLIRWKWFRATGKQRSSTLSCPWFDLSQYLKYNLYNPGLTNLNILNIINQSLTHFILKKHFKSPILHIHILNNLNIINQSLTNFILKRHFKWPILQVVCGGLVMFNKVCNEKMVKNGDHNYDKQLLFICLNVDNPQCQNQSSANVSPLNLPTAPTCPTTSPPSPTCSGTSTLLMLIWSHPE